MPHGLEAARGVIRALHKRAQILAPWPGTISARACHIGKGQDPNMPCAENTKTGLFFLPGAVH
jgi:formylmethanofuran:tetrahydromethanopterin formyltransferase